MFNSLKMTRLDYYTFKKQIIGYASLVLITIMFAAIGSPFITLNITASWFVALLSTDIFAIQEKNELERLYATLSIELENIIIGRYIFLFMNYVFALILSIFVGVAASVLQNKKVDSIDIILGICISLFVFTIIMDIQIPIFFKLGYTKARVWGMVPFISVMAIVILFSLIDAFSDIIAALIKHQVILGIICLLISFAILPVSYHLSVKCYRKRR